MTQPDILAALAGTAPRGNSRCVVQRWLDDIADNTPGKAELVEAIECGDKNCPQYRTIVQALAILRSLGFSTSDGSVGHHRANRCRCDR